ncbi:MAG: ABC transporter ATP-binding protein [Proteobacteria bacterium]|nr:ABC transporter ATP-binding protein [Pseudomonadota bacterium]
MKHLKRLLPYLRRYRLPFWGGMIGLLIARVFEALIPLYLKDAIDIIAGGHTQLLMPTLSILGCVLGRFLSIVVSRRLIRRIGVAVSYDLRKRIYSHLQKQGPGFFGRFGTGDLMARAINDIQLVRFLVDSGTRTVVVLFFCAAVALVFMAKLSPSLTLLMAPPLPFIILVAYLLSKRMYTYSVIVQEGFAEFSDQVQENLNGIRTVQALVQETEEIERFDKINAQYADDFLEMVRTNSLLNLFMPALGSVCAVIVLGYGGSRVMTGEISVGTFTAFFWYLGMLLWPMRAAGDMVTMWQRGASGAQRIFEILDTVPDIRDQPEKGVPKHLSGALEINDLSFRYPKAAKPVLENISLKIETGQTVAILGPIGSGKSTLLKLLVRLLDPPPGTILLDDHDAAAYPLAQIREQVVLVLQESFLFADSLFANLTYDDPERPAEEVWKAAESADLKETILNFPEQMDTVVGERGITLSGGQKQRTTLARGLIRQAPILLLDDCFSSIDTETEEIILKRLSNLRKGRTTLLVSHRVSTVRHADRIVVLDEARIAETGTHQELMERNGIYARIERIQNRRSELLKNLESQP